MDQNAQRLQPTKDAMQKLADSVATLTKQAQQDGSSQEAEEVTARILDRVSQVLTAEDMEKIKELDGNDPSGDVVKYFIMTKVPNLEAIIQEEIDAYKNGEALLR